MLKDLTGGYSTDSSLSLSLSHSCLCCTQLHFLCLSSTISSKASLGSSISGTNVTFRGLSNTQNLYKTWAQWGTHAWWHKASFHILVVRQLLNSIPCLFAIKLNSCLLRCRNCCINSLRERIMQTIYGPVDLSSPSSTIPSKVYSHQTKAYAISLSSLTGDVHNQAMHTTIHMLTEHE